MSLIFSSPQDAETAFYDAFQNGNIEAMMSIWSNDEDIICIHPNSPRLQGRELIQESWLQIFASEVEVRFEIADAQYLFSLLLFVKDNAEIHLHDIHWYRHYPLSNLNQLQ